MPTDVNDFEHADVRCLSLDYFINQSLENPNAPTVLMLSACDADAARMSEGYMDDHVWMSWLHAPSNRLRARGLIVGHRRGAPLDIAPEPLSEPQGAIEREERRNTPPVSTMAREIAFDILHDLRGYTTDDERLAGAAVLAQRVLDNYPNTPPIGGD